jgi:hypothetical protein
MRKSFCSIVLSVLLLTSYSTCSGQVSRGTYRIERKKSTPSTENLINGSIIDFDTRKPVQATFIQIGSVFVSTDSVGKFQCTLPPGKYRMRVGFIGYYWLYTSKISLRKGEQLTIVFSLKEDTRPIID